MTLLPSAVIHKPSGGASYTALGNIVSSCVFDLDATIAASYGGSGQTWANIEPTPADSAAQTDYDFYLGAGSGSSTDDPTFTGTAGNSAAYWAFDGGDFFSQVVATSTNFVKKLQRTDTGQDFTLVMAMQFGAVNLNQGLFNQNNSSTTRGIRAIMNSAAELRLLQRGDSAITSYSSGVTLSVATDYIIAFGHKHATNESMVYKSGAGITTGTHTYNTCVNDASDTQLLCDDSNLVSLANGSRVYGISMFNAYLDSTAIAAIESQYETRHGRTY